MDAADKRMLEREALRNMIQQWNANRLDLFALSEPNENLEFHGVMRFYFQDLGQKIATKCIRVASDATVSDVIETLIEKFRPDMRMLSLGSYSLWETHGPDDERKLEPHEKPLLVQLNWHADDREGRFLLKCLSNNEVPLSSASDKGDQNFKRKLSKREKKELKKKEKLSRLKSDTNDENRPVAEKLYTELPETSFMRSISNPEAVMRRRRQQKLGRKLQQFKSKDGGPDTGGTLRIYGGILRPDVSYITLLLSVNDSAATVLRETLDKYGMAHQDPLQYCIVQEDKSDNSEYILEDDECPLALMNMTRSSIMFHVRRRPADAQPRRRKKKASTGGTGVRPGNEPVLVEVAPDSSPLENGRRVRVTDAVEVGSGNGTTLQLYGPSIQPRHCVVAPAEGGGYTVTPLHADAHVYLNGQRVVHTQRLQHGCLLKFGRVSMFRFMDPAQENIINRNLAQSQHYGSGSIYDRSPTSGGENSGAMSPTSLASHQPDALDSNANTTDNDYMRTMSPVSHDTYYRDSNDPAPYNNNTLKLDNESLMMSQNLSDSKDDYGKDEHSGSVYNVHEQSANANRTANSQYKDNYETTFDLEGNVETKSICSAKSGGSGHENRSGGGGGARGQEAILPAVLEFPDAGQAQFLSAVITRLDPHAPAFKLAPVYTLYLCARYRASTHYRTELTPTERAHKLTAFLHHVATLIHATVQERAADSAAQAFWMANASELLHFLKYDRHISSFSTQAQELLPVTVQTAFSNLVSCFQEELSRALGTLTSGATGGALGDATEATAPTLQALAAAMVLLRRCRVNAALTIQLFSHLFHYINAVCFNKLVTEPNTVSRGWGVALSSRLALLAAWAERQGLELAADCHLARTHQAARLIQGSYNTAEEAVGALGACFKLNSVQVRALLTPLVLPDVLEAAVHHARERADELCRADGREVRLEESEWLGAGLLVPADGFSAEVVRGVPPGLAEFVAPLQRGGLCRLAHQPHAPGAWTVYMAHPQPPRATHPRAHPPRLHIVHLHKNANGMGLSIVAAKGAGQSKLGIYIKSVVPGGAAAADGRLAAGDQLLSVDGQSLVGITQEKAAEYLVRTGPTVTLEVAKQGAMLHGLATLLHQPAYNQRQAPEEIQYEDPARRNSGTFTNMHPALLKPTSPLTELATAGYGRRPCQYRCHLLRDESTESSTTDDSEEYHTTYHGSIPRLIITLDRENDQLQEDLSPDTPGCPLELKDPPPQRPIPIFTFTCEDFDEQNQNSECTDSVAENTQEVPPPVPDLPFYEQSSESGETVPLPPQMRPIDTKLTLELFNTRGLDNEAYRRRCTALDECVSACECCRTPQPEAQPIPFIDEPDSEPFIFENDGVPDKVATPKMRRILPSLSLDRPDDTKVATADAVCQTPSSPVRDDVKLSKSTPIVRRVDVDLDVKSQSQKFENIHCRLKRALFSMSKSYSSKSEGTEIPSTYSTSQSFNKTNNEHNAANKTVVPTSVEPGAKKILDSVDRKSWKSPDEFRPAFGKVKALTKHFNDINLTYSVKIYKRICQSSPNLSTRNDKTAKIIDAMPTSTSLADIQYEVEKTDTSESKRAKMSDDEVKSILIQLEDWSRYGSRGSEDTLAQGNEFELPNLPVEECASNGYVFNEIVDKKPKTITLDNIKLKSNQSSVNSDQVKRSKESLARSESIGNVDNNENRERSASTGDVSEEREGTSRRSWSVAAVQSCPDVWRGSARGRAACTAAPTLHSCPALHTPPQSGGVSGGAVRRASERDLPSRLAAEPVKPSKSTPALHHAASASPHRQHVPDASNAPLLHDKTATASPAVASSSPSAWAGKSRSSHNLSAGSHHDGFYQNLSTVHSHHHALQDRWSSLRSSTGSNRPQSAHFSAALQPDQPPDSPLHQTQQANAVNARAAKLAELSEEVSRRQLAAGAPQYMSQRAPALLPHHHPLHNHHHIHGQSQAAQMAMQMSPQMSPQMPTQIPNHMPNQMPNQISQMPNQMSSQMSNQVSTLPNQMSSQMSNQVSTMPNQMSSQMATQMSTQISSQMSMASGPHNTYSQHQMYHNQHGQPQRYEWHPPGPPSPMRMQPPIAPKPQNSRRSEMEIEEHLHQQQQQQQQPQPQTISTVQPDDERYVASALEPPAVSVYPTGGTGGVGGGAGGGRTQPAHNPWQREERERQAETRRAAARARRDAAIAQLLSMGASRTPVQNQQLRALQLERDFELRATQHDQEEGAAAEGGAEEERSSPEQSDDSERMHVQQALHTHVHTSALSSAGNVLPTHVPKSILKTNTRSDITNGYATETLMHEDGMLVSEACAGVSALNMSAPAPAPPARGSSFAVMAERSRALSPPQAAHVQHTQYTQHVQHAQHSNQQHPHQVQHTPAETAQPPQSPVNSGRDKRVSFHERAQAAPPAAPPPAPPTSSPPPLHDPPQREDPDRFLEEAESMLASPVSPTTPVFPSGPVTHTPGVIGAQEVYRDPRARRLAEREARAPAAPIPEHLSFKEKMKMFALESGEASTPKDKVKISRAQRDIDAVH